MPTRVNREQGWRFAERGSHLCLPNDPANASDMRSFVGEFMARSGIPEHVADEILMAVGEVVANSCRHGRKVAGMGEVALRCELRDPHIAITVTDDGPGFDTAIVLQAGLPDLLSAGGRGFFLMRQLMDRVDVDSSAAGTTVILERQLNL
jgi:anti-sigma regulatory factor (Ser/Thr protein kinase)